MIGSTGCRRSSSLLFLRSRSSARFFSTSPPPSSPVAATTTQRTSAGTGKQFDENPGSFGFHNNRGPVTWGALGLVAVAAASAVSYYQIERERRLEEAMGKIVTSESDGWSPSPKDLAPRKWKQNEAGEWFPIVNDVWGGAGKPAIGGPWSLVDLNGNLVTEENFKGKWLLLYFGFARCPDICPSEMVKVGKVMDILEVKYPKLRPHIVPIFVSVDPARDSLKALKEYAKDFHPSYIFLTGSPQQVEQMAKKYRVYVSKADETDDGDYLVDHSIVIYFHDDTGDLADCFTQSMRASDVVERVVDRMLAVKQE